MRPIRRGERSAAVQDLQARIQRVGYEIALAELGGAFGASTERAVRAFQQDRGVRVDGIVGEVTWGELVESSWSLGDRILRLQDPLMRGDDVRDLQSRLNALGFPAGKHDGLFGSQTVAALREMQRNLGVTEDGIVGHETVRALERLRLVTRTGLGPRIREREERKAQAPGLAGKRVALDPGHGGDDPGESAPCGETEADLAYRLAVRLAAALEGRGAATMLTRGPNDGPDESDRARLANAFEAHLLISVHLNAYPGAEAGGAATYYFERGGVASEPGEHLATLVQRALVASGRVDCRTHGKAHAILAETRMPAILVEPAFLTNPDEMKVLRDEACLGHLAEAMAGAVESYFSR